MYHPLNELINNRQKGNKAGITSICSANEFVIKAGMLRALEKNSYLLLEATANQVNQYGGYTGMRPKDFKEYVFLLARGTGFPTEKILLGGDHLGPLSWNNEKSAEAMAMAEELIAQYVKAGFTKIHIDCSMPLGDDNKSIRIDPKVIAQRSARLTEAAESAFQELRKTEKNALHPVYVIGSEVPIPGGLKESTALQITAPESFEETISLFQEALTELGISEAYRYVIAVVIQPGVEFSNDSIHHYKRNEASALCSALQKYPNLVFEGHSTDYQCREALKQMVEDGIAILKVGPALTFTFREGVFMLSLIEKELLHREPENQAYFIEVLESVMLENPALWKPYCHGDNEALRRARRYGLSDRSRYYLTHYRVKEAVNRLLKNLSKREIPFSLISQYLPLQYERIREGKISNTPEALLVDKVGCLLDQYSYATNG